MFVLDVILDKGHAERLRDNREFAFRLVGWQCYRGAIKFGNGQLIVALAQNRQAHRHAEALGIARGPKQDLPDSSDLDELLFQACQRPILDLSGIAKVMTFSADRAILVTMKPTRVRIKFARMPLDLGDDPARFCPACRLINEICIGCRTSFGGGPIGRLSSWPVRSCWMRFVGNRIARWIRSAGKNQ
jgi:hypothetical protein